MLTIMIVVALMCSLAFYAGWLIAKSKSKVFYQFQIDDQRELIKAQREEIARLRIPILGEIKAGKIKGRHAPPYPDERINPGSNFEK